MEAVPVASDPLGLGEQTAEKPEDGPSTAAVSLVPRETPRSDSVGPVPAPVRSDSESDASTSPSTRRPVSRAQRSGCQSPWYYLCCCCCCNRGRCCHLPPQNTCCAKTCCCLNPDRNCAPCVSRECSVDCESWNTWGCALLVVVALVLFVLVVVGSFYVTDVVHRAQSRQVVRCLDRVYLPEDDVTRVTIRMWTPLVGVDDSWFSLVAPFTALDDVLAVDLSGNVTDATIRLDAHQQLAYQIRFDPTPPPSLAACSATSLQLAELHIPSDSSLTAPDLAAALDAVLLSPISSFNESFALYPYPVRCRLAAN